MAFVGGNAQAQGLPVSLTLDQEIYEAGDEISMLLEAPPFSKPFLVLGTSPGLTPIKGVGDFQMGLIPPPMIVGLPLMPASGERDLGCEAVCDDPLIEVPCLLQVVSFDLLNGGAGISNLEVLRVAAGDCGVCVEEAEVDPNLGSNGGHAFWIPDLAKDFEFVAGGDFSERDDGTARIIGVIASESQPELRFQVDVEFRNRISVGDLSHPPSGSPKKELDGAAYIENDGPIHPGNWHYYDITDGMLTGLGEQEGAKIELSRRGPAFQVGYGANGKNLNWGGSGWFDLLTVCQPFNDDPLPLEMTGDINVSLGQCEECPSAAISEPGFSPNVASHAVALPGISSEFIFDGDVSYVERRDGTASLSGIIVRDDDPNKRFELSVEFLDRINPGASNYPPSDSPKKELQASAYLEHGGIIDPDAWHYYELTVGTLIGLDDYAGAVLHLQRKGPAFQVGQGASGKNRNYGASGWLMWELLSQVDSGPALPDSGSGDINIDLDRECVDPIL